MAPNSVLSSSWLAGSRKPPPRPAAPSCRVRIGTSPASFPQVEARPVATRRSELAACIVANHHHSPTTPSLHVVAACRIASQNTDDRRRAWLAFTHHDASPDTLSSQHEPCGGRGASPTRRRPTSIAALSTVTAARRQTAARCASAGHVSLVAQTWAAMLMRSRKQSSPQGRDRPLGAESRDGKWKDEKPPPKVGIKCKRAFPGDPNPKTPGLAPFLLPRT